MGKIFPHRRRKARLSPPTWPPQPVENDVELRERIAKERETRRRLADHRSRRMAERREKRERLAASWAATRSVLDLAERLAQDVFPWPLIVHECRLFDTIVKLRLRLDATQFFSPAARTALVDPCRLWRISLSERCKSSIRAPLRSI